MSDIEIRAAEESDVTSLRALFAGLSDRDRTLMKDDMSASGAVERLVSDPGARFVALDEDTVVGILVIVPGVAWSRHVAQLRIVSIRLDVAAASAGHWRAAAWSKRSAPGAPSCWPRCSPTTMPRWRCSPLSASTPRPCSRITCATTGTMRDLLLLSHFVDHDWAAMATTGLDELIEE